MFVTLVVTWKEGALVDYIGIQRFIITLSYLLATLGTFVKYHLVLNIIVLTFNLLFTLTQYYAKRKKHKHSAN